MKVKEYLNIKEYTFINDGINFRLLFESNGLFATRTNFLKINDTLETFNIYSLYKGLFIFEINELNDEKIKLMERWLNSECEEDFKFEFIKTYNQIKELFEGIVQGIAFSNPMRDYSYCIFNLLED